MGWAERHGNGWRGVYRAPDGITQRRTATVTAEREAEQIADDAEAKIRNGDWFDPLAGLVALSEYYEK